MKDEIRKILKESFKAEMGIDIFDFKVKSFLDLRDPIIPSIFWENLINTLSLSVYEKLDIYLDKINKQKNEISCQKEVILRLRFRLKELESSTNKNEEVERLKKKIEKTKFSLDIMALIFMNLQDESLE